MAKAKSATQSYPATFTVVNTGKRTRTRNGVRFQGSSKNEKPEPVEVTVGDRREYLRLKGCKDLQVSPATKGAAKKTPGDDA